MTNPSEPLPPNSPNPEPIFLLLFRYASITVPRQFSVSSTIPNFVYFLDNFFLRKCITVQYVNICEVSDNNVSVIEIYNTSIIVSLFIKNIGVFF